MTIQLKSLEWDNYFSFGKGNRVDFTDNKVTQILGVNGNGKSSIPLILEEVCYNKNSKGISKADIPNRYLDDQSTRAKLFFTVNGVDYTLEVIRKSSIKVILKRGDEDMSAHTSTGTFKLVEELLGMDFKTFSQLVYQSTTSSLQFLTATDTNRKKFLIDLLQLSTYVEYSDLFKEVAKDTQSALNVANGRKDTLLKWLKDNEVTDLTEKPVVALSDTTFEIEQSLGKVQSDIANISKENKRISQNLKYKEMFDKLPPLGAPPGEAISYEEDQRELGSHEVVLRTATAQLQKLQKLGDACPTCEQAINNEFKRSLIDEQEELSNSARDAIQEIKSRIETAKKHNEAVAAYARSQKEFEDLHNLIDFDAPTVLLELEDLQAQETTLRHELASIEALIQKTTKANMEAMKHNSRIQVYLEQAEKAKAELEKLTADVDKIAHDLSELEILKKAFSTNGLIAYKIENLVKELEDLANDYLVEFSDGRFTIEFNVVSDKLNVDLTDNGRSISITALSSGELARVNTSTLLAIRSLMNSLSKTSLNVLFLDEVISVLDDYGRERLVEILLKEDLNTYLVSHSWSHPLLAKLEVIKEDNVSRLG